MIASSLHSRVAARSLLQAVLVVLGSLGVSIGTAHADPEPMTRTEIIDLAKGGVGHGYKWGFGHWTADGSQMAECQRMECDDCNCIKRDDENMCTNWYPKDTVGADCSGFTAKVWQVPDPSEITENRHPYSTKQFKESRTHWTEIERSELKQGDALVYRNAKDTGGHIVVFDSFTATDDKYHVYEAKGCAHGIVYNEKVMGAEYIAIRRNDVSDFECTDNACNGNGECSEESGCKCELGYTGTHCDRCELGFVGYPTCRRADDEAAPAGRIACEMAAVEVRPQEAASQMSRYACNLAGEGGEVAYRFDPTGLGKATIRLGGDTSGKSLALLRGACSAAGCVASNATELSFDFSDNEVFYVVVESEPGASGVATLSVDCGREGAQKFIGDPCNDASDCEFEAGGQRGRCYQTDGGGFCTTSCTRTCPDLAGVKAPTFCVEDPASDGDGICVSQAHALNSQCGGIPGTGAEVTSRINDSATTRNVCMPGGAAPVCQGGFAGRVVDHSTGEPIAGAEIIVSGEADMTLTTSADGSYNTANMPCGSYTLEASALGYLRENLHVEVLAGQTTQITRLRALLTSACEELGSLEGRIFDALSPERAAVPGARIEIWPGLGGGVGPVMINTEAGDDGTFRITDLAPGNYSIAITADGYAETIDSVVVCGQPESPVELALTPSSELPFRIQVSWAQPDDLDLHVQLPNGNEVYFFKPCRGDIEDPPYARLDVDRRMADGPEVASISHFAPGRYTVFVHNYSTDVNDGQAQLGDSQAELVVYGAGGTEVLGRYSVPSGSGNSWDVLWFDGSNPSVLHPIQTLTTRENPEDYAEDCRP